MAVSQKPSVPTELPAPSPSETVKTKPSPTKKEVLTVAPEVQARLDEMEAMDYETYSTTTTAEERAMYIDAYYLRKIKSDARLYYKSTDDPLDLFPETDPGAYTYDEVLSAITATARTAVIVAASKDYEEGMKIMVSAAGIDGRLSDGATEVVLYYKEHPNPRMNAILLSLEGNINRKSDGNYYVATSYTDDQGRACYDTPVSDFCLLDYTNQYGKPAQVWGRVSYE